MLDDRVALILADKNPEMKRSTDYPELRNRIKVKLDDADVTRLCRGFSLPAQQVELFVEARVGGPKLFEWRCGCGVTRGTHWEYGTEPRICKVCGLPFEGPAIAIDTRLGKVEVDHVRGVEMKLSPGDYLAEYVGSPLPVRLDRVWFTIRLWWPLLCRRPINAGRDLLPILWRMMTT